MCGFLIYINKKNKRLDENKINNPFDNKVLVIDEIHNLISMMTKANKVNAPYLYGNEKKYLQKCISDGFVSSGGPFVEKFEKKFSKRLKRKFAISVSNGTAALQLAFESLNIKKKIK